MWQFIQNIFRVVVFEPELNLLYGLFQLTGDIGISIILLAVVVNLLVLPLFAKNYISLQKTKILQPQIKAIQAKYKEEPQKMLAMMREFNQKHGIRNGYIFLVLLFQLFFLTGLFWVIQAVVNGDDVSGLYEVIWGGGKTVANFKDANGQMLAFGFMDITSDVQDYLWLPFIGLILSYLYGMYTFRWAPKPVLPVAKPKKKVTKKDKPVSAFDPESMQKTIEFQALYFMPLFLFFIQFSLPTGLNLYFVTTSAFSLVRQIFLTRYYASHTDKLIKDIIDSDPSIRDNNPDNNLEITADPIQMANDQIVATSVVNKPNKTKKLVKKPKNKASKRKAVKA
jgi:YidC/Oxa1 family membrane protein insertase